MTALTGPSETSVEHRKQALRRRQPIRRFDEVGDEVPVLVLDQRMLRTGGRLAPDPPPPGVGVMAHGEDLVANPPRGIADPAALGRLRQRQADRPRPLEQLLPPGSSREPLAAIREG